MIGDKYRIVSLIGRGGMGAVYKVHQVFLGKEFALKVLDLHKRSDVSVRRFQQEASTASQLQHANLVEVHDFGMFGDDQPYLVMDLVDGQSLSQILKKTGALSIDYTIALSIQLCFGLMYAHDKGVVHRDIKPANIMLLHPDEEVAEGNVKIVDFGIAKLTQSEDGEIQSLTKTGEVFGSPLYMSPEQCKGTGIDKRSDIYSLGCVIFECLTGSPPFFGDTAMSTMMKKLSEQPVSLKEGSLGREFPVALEDIVRKCLAIKLEDRYQDLSRLIGDLIALQRRDTISIAPVEPKSSTAPRETATGRQALLVVAVMVISSLATAAFDRIFVFNPQPATVKSGEQTEEVAPTPEMSAEFHDVKQYLGTADVTQLKKTFPWFETKLNSAGEKMRLIHFPVLFGGIEIDGRPDRPAVGEIECRPEARIKLRLARLDSGEPTALKNLIGLNIIQLSYDGSFAADDDTISIIDKFPSLETLYIGGTGVTSTKVINKLPLLEIIDCENTKIPTSELLKLKRLGDLKAVWFGPVKDPERVFKALAKTNAVSFLSYDGGGKGFSRRVAAELSKLTNIHTLRLESCPSLDDADFAQLSTLKNLQILKVENCGLTGKSMVPLKGFKHLSQVSLTVEGWEQADVDDFLNLKIRKSIIPGKKGLKDEGRSRDENLAPLMR